MSLVLVLNNVLLSRYSNLNKLGNQSFLLFFEDLVSMKFYIEVLLCVIFIMICRITCNVKFK